MPALRNQRQERFCQLVKQGIPPYRAYPQAGYKAHPGEPYRLRENPRVKARIAEITRSLAVKTKVTVESLTEELDEARALAATLKQPAAMMTATTAKAKLHGLMVDRKETGEPGAFQSLQSEADVLAKVAAELGQDAASVLAKALQSTPGDDAPAAEESEIAPTNEGPSTVQ